MNSHGFGTFWHGMSLGPLEKACLNSFIRAGQSLSIFSYEAALQGVPDGVKIEDASKVLKLTNDLQVILDQHPARFSDLFRLRMMQATGRIWVDCDVYYLRPVTCVDNLITIGRRLKDGSTFIWNGVMYLDPESDLFQDYLSLMSSETIQFRDAWNTRIDCKENSDAKGFFDQSGEFNFYTTDLPRNFFGPILLSLLVLEHGFKDLVRASVHYPFGAPKLRKNIRNPEAFPLALPGHSETLHFFGSMVREVCQSYLDSDSRAYKGLPHGSLLARSFSNDLV